MTVGGPVVFDVAVIGGGIVGLSTARALLAARGRSLVVLEAEHRLAEHQSGRNSGVIHSGIYYTPGSSKAIDCVAGRQALVRFCRRHDIPCRRCGKLIVASCRRDLPRLQALAQRGRANGLRGLQLLGVEQVAEIEPHIRVTGGLWVPQTGVVDFKLVTERLGEVVRRRGGEIRTAARVVAVRPGTSETMLATTAGDVRCRFVVNCAGLQCERVAKMCGVKPGLRIVPFRGVYLELAPHRRGLVRGLVYPAPDPRLPFLGIHLTRTIDGRVTVGPNAVLALTRGGYGRCSFSWNDAWDTLSYPGLWRLAAGHWRRGLSEHYRWLNRHAFAAALRRLLPDVAARDLLPGRSGIRAQAVAPDGTFADDFRVVEGPRSLHVLNAPSPAATAALRIGARIAARLAG